ncbi:CCN family member 2-like [Patiria miniata]|uniref:IGFBP N-terminal domain-containing protein n=1 Tax=Patiria miniata TaxID=46514 RepID=A0A913ZQ34_PATMI|nr:CCN family member 2-like [Patiria miniata]
MKIAVVLAVFAMFVQGGQSLGCKPCSEVKCVSVLESDCYKGAELVTDHCGCCDVCSKGYDEPCGGLEMMGECSQHLGLYCQLPRCKNPNDIVCKSQPGICKL